MIKFTDVSFGFPQKELYDKICFEIEEGEHAVLIGSNGTGKSTLIDMLLNPEKYLYDGKIERSEEMNIGYLSQFVKHEESDCTAFEYLAQPFSALQAQADAICAEMETAEDMDEVYARYQVCLDEMEAIDAYNHEVNIRKQLAVAGLTEIADTRLTQISGGEYKLLSIIKSMLLKPEILIMDEPDVFLDFENLIGLIRLINLYDGTLLTVTHNRLLLNRCFDKILHLENMELQEFPGSFAEYNQAMLENKVRTQEQAAKEAEWIEIQKVLIEQLRDAATENSDPRNGRQLRARVSYLERLTERQVKDPFVEEHDYDFTFPEVETEPDREAETLLSVRDYTLAYDREILSNVSFDVREGDKIALVGANGTGKTSLLRELYRRLQEERGDTDVGFFSQIYDSDSPDKLSGGERNILHLRELSESSARILFLDEPTSHLDLYAQMALEKAVSDYRGTVVMVSHDFYTITNCADRILILENGTLREMSGRAYRKSIYRKYFDSETFEQERSRKEKEVKINSLLKAGKFEEAKKLL